MQLAVWLVICLALAIGLLHRHELTLLAAVLILLVLPSWDAGIITGLPYDSGGAGVPAIMPVTWFLICAVAVRVLFFPNLLQDLRSGYTPLVSLGTVLLWATFVTLSRTGIHGLAELIDSLLAPLLFLFLASLRANESGVRYLQRAILAIALAEACFAVLEYALKRDVLFVLPLTLQQQFAAEHGVVYRAAGTLDHPLTLGVFLVIGLGLTFTIKSRRARLVARFILICGIAATGSRAGLVAAVVILLVGGGGEPTLRRVAAGAVTAGLIALLVFATPVGDLVRARAASDLGSTAVRLAAYQAFGHLYTHYLVWGGGVGSSFTLSAQLTSTHASFESPLIMWSIDIGIAGTLLLFWALIRLLWVPGSDPSLRRTALVSLVLMCTYSSFATKTEAGLILAIAIALPRLSRELTGEFLVDAGRLEPQRSVHQARRSYLSERPRPV